MSRPHKYDNCEEIWKKIAELYSFGMAPREISKIVGYAERTIRTIVLRFGISRSKREAAHIRLKTAKLSKRGYQRMRVGNKEPLVHRLIAEKMIGRKLLRSEEVHHKNKNRRDNRPENLQVMSKSAHKTLHNHEYWNSRRLNGALL